MQEETIKTPENVKEEWIKNRNRYVFQGFLVNRILGKQPAFITDKEWNEKKAELVSDMGYGQKFSYLIDNNIDYINTLMKGEEYYEEVADKIINELHIKVAA